MEEKTRFAGKGAVAVISSLMLIFAFGSMDIALSPMIDIFRDFYRVPGEKILYLISACTTGIIAGVALGPALTGSSNVLKVALAGISGLVLSLFLFINHSDFNWALVFRFIFGLSAGVITSAFWWMAYHGLEKACFQPMITVLMAGRPLAVGVGMPLLGLLSYNYGWKPAFMTFLALMVLSGTLLAVFFPKDSDKKVKFRPGALIADYLEAFKPPSAPGFYLALTVVKVCYLGFYTLTGLWFSKNYGLSPCSIAGTLMYIGIAEGTVNFIVPFLFKRFGEKAVFRTSLFLSPPVFILLYFGGLSLSFAVAAFALFAMLDRVYTMAVVVLMPEVFPHCPNKTVMGSLLTLSSWVALTVIAWAGGAFLGVIGLKGLGAVLSISLLTGGLMLSSVMNGTAFSEKRGSLESAPEG